MFEIEASRRGQASFFTVLKKLRKFADFATSLWRDAVRAGAAALLVCPRIIDGVDICSI
jgi:hypothetical protein